MSLSVAQLNEQFGLGGVLHFDEHEGLQRAQVTGPAGSATVYLQGAHVTHWQPAGQAPVLYLSPISVFAAGKAIRGGVPVCWPWFAADSGNHDAGQPGPTHGFARTEAWELTFAALAGKALHLTLTLGPSEESRRYGFDHFRLAYEVIVAETLTLRLSVANIGTTPLAYEEALHTYFAADPRRAEITGLESAAYLDKTDGFARKTGPATPLLLDRATDRVYPGAVGTVVIHDGAQTRTIVVEKQRSHTTVVWSPYPELSAALKDLPADGWEHFLCVETANAGADRVTLEPGKALTMEARYTVAKMS